MRTSPVHYIAPSGISITPNANNSHRDLAVYVAKGTKIKVYCPRAGIGMDADTSTYQEWTFDGRNRRLADTTGTVPYTIYARLSKSDHKTGYLVFSKKIQRGNDWIDAYSSLTLDINSTDGYSVRYTDNGNAVKTKDPDNYYVRLGDVSVVEDGLRTVTLDTGILGTDDYNNNWAQNPDDLPLRIELGCTIDDEDVGLTPYVYWNQSLVLTATLVEGWARMDIQRFDHWEIMRKTDDNPAESNWLDSSRKVAFSTSGEITLYHNRNSDDFNGSVATTFTIMAIGHPQNSVSSDSSSSEDTVVVLKTATITILAETIERYELALSANIVGYNPQANTFDPASITARIRATDQRGNVFELTKRQFDNAGLAVEYAPVDSNAWAPLTFSGEGTAVATASLNTATAFALRQSLNVRLVRIIEIGSSSDSSSSDGTDVTELMQQTIAFVRDGEDSKEREWIFLCSQTAITFGTQEHPNPADITYGQVTPTQAAGHVTNDSNQDSWVPEGWWDEMQGTDENTPYEYGSYRDYIHDSDISSSESSSSDDVGHWGPFSTPKIWSHYGKDGTPGTIYERRYRSLNVEIYPDSYPTTENAPSGWGDVNIPSQISTTARYRWMIERYSNDNGTTWSNWSPPVITEYLAADGTSISIKGRAAAVIPWGGSLPASSTDGSIYLMNNEDANSINQYNNGLWDAVTAAIGDGYLVDGHLWIKLRETASVSDPRWKDMGQIKGDKGDDAEYYALSSPDIVIFRRNYAGVASDVTTSLVLTLTHNVGNTQEWLSDIPIGMTLKTSTNGTTWNTTFSQSLERTVATDFVSGSNVYPRVYYGLFKGSTLIDSDYTDVQYEVQRMLIPAGTYENKQYNRTINTTPLVYVDIGNGNGTYWFLVADNNGTESPYTAPGSNDNVWQQASEFDVVLTKMLFARFANLGSFIVYDRYFFSQYGDIINSSGDVVQSINAVTPNYNGQVGYSYFDPADPMATTHGTHSLGKSVWFRPTKCINALTGDEWGASGNVYFKQNGDTFIRGEVQMTAGSQFPDGTDVAQTISGIIDGQEQIREDIETLDTGNENLLLNTGFTGDYDSDTATATTEVDADTEMWSPKLKYWEGANVEVMTESSSATGLAASITAGLLKQTVNADFAVSDAYCISLKAYGTAIEVSFGGNTETLNLTDHARRYILRLNCLDATAKDFVIGGTAKVMEVMLTRGKIPNADWIPSPLDNDKALAYYQNISYLANAIANANTSILGGLILTQMIRVGNYRDGSMAAGGETGGMSGIYTSEQSPFLWGGGDMEQAFYTIGKYARDPSYQATEEEVRRMAKFVVTHGGRAILNDIVLRGYIYALGGYFKGEVHALNGSFRSKANGNSINIEGGDAILTISGPARSLEWEPDKGYQPDPTAPIVDFLKAEVFTDPDGLYRGALLSLLSHVFGDKRKIEFDAGFGIRLTGYDTDDETEISRVKISNDDDVTIYRKNAVTGIGYTTTLDSSGISWEAHYPDGYTMLQGTIVAWSFRNNGQLSLTFARQENPTITGILDVDSNGYLKINPIS